MCIWVVTHIRIILGEIYGKDLKEDMKLKEELSRKSDSKVNLELF